MATFKCKSKAQIEHITLKDEHTAIKTTTVADVTKYFVSETNLMVKMLSVSVGLTNGRTNEHSELYRQLVRLQIYR